MQENNQISIFDSVDVPAPRANIKSPRLQKKKTPGNVKAQKIEIASDRSAPTSAMAATVTPSVELATFINGLLKFASDELFEPKTGIALNPVCAIPHRSRKSSVGGYFMSSSWQNSDGKTVHEIAISPPKLMGLTLRELFALVVHEACHLWLCDNPTVHGDNGKKGYHGHPFTKIMAAIGLVPSKSGLPGSGPDTGVQMWHREADDGVFLAAFQKLEATGIKAPWGTTPDIEKVKKTKSGKRSSYKCSTDDCDCKASGRIGLVMFCGEHKDKPMVETLPKGMEAPLEDDGEGDGDDE